MLRPIARISAFPAAFAGSAWFATLPAWSVLQFLALFLLALAACIWIGRVGALFLAIALLAGQGSDADGGGFVRLFLPLVAFVAVGGVLVCTVLRFPALGDHIEHGGH